MNLKRIQRTAWGLREKRLLSRMQEEGLQLAIQTACQKHGASHQLAIMVGVTDQYLCDLRYGRRHVSDELLERFIALGEPK